jgi:hypothetical protein
VCGCILEESRRNSMSFALARFTAGLGAVAALIAAAPAVSADPVWPVPGAQSAAATIADLQAQGYDVRINWVSGRSSVDLSRCSVSAIHNPDRSATGPTTFTTVYVDVSCPNDDWDTGGISIGVLF